MGRSSKYKDEDEEEEEDEIEVEDGPTRPSYYHWTDSLLSIDMYGAKPEFEIRGKKKVKSCWGASMSFIAGFLIFLYFCYKLLYNL